jgi:hypothetical protein
VHATVTTRRTSKSLGGTANTNAHIADAAAAAAAEPATGPRSAFAKSIAEGSCHSYGLIPTGDHDTNYGHAAV